MTAEAVVLNKAAVAMAADSAVTISVGERGIKTYNTVNKLFELIKGKPVGIMIYSSPELNGVPWETIIKMYRARRQNFSSPSLSGYVEDFLDFLDSSGGFLFTEESEQLAFVEIVSEAFGTIKFNIESDVMDCQTRSGRIVKKALHQLIDASIKSVENKLSKAQDGRWQNLSESSIGTKYSELIIGLVESLFESEWEISSAQKKRLTKIALVICSKHPLWVSASGLVIAGFGDDDPFPSLHPIDITGRVLGTSRVVKYRPTRIGDQKPGAYKTFAQDEMAKQFITGINQRTRRETTQFWQKWFRKAHQELVKELHSKHPKLSQKTIDSISNIVLELNDEGGHKFADHMNSHQNAEFEQPLISSIAYLPKDELAHMAETLVNLTSVMQRFNIVRQETVGGEIDVVLISQGDGLVWLKRKHYFSLELNPAWPELHS